MLTKRGAMPAVDPGFPTPGGMLRAPGLARCALRAVDTASLSTPETPKEIQMRRLLLSLALASACAVHAAPASQASVEALLQVTKAESMMDAMFVHMEQMMRAGMQQATRGKTLSEEQQRVLDAVPAKFLSVMRSEMNWQTLKPQFIKLYQDTFEQAEVDGMLSFYASPAGQALIHKMPVVMQKSMQLSQTLMQSAMPRMQAALEEAIKEAKLSSTR